MSNEIITSAHRTCICLKKLFSSQNAQIEKPERFAPVLVQIWVLFSFEDHRFVRTQNSMHHFSISDALKLTRQVLWLSCFPRPSRSGWLGLPRLAWCPVETCLSGVGWLYSRITLQLDNVAIRGAHWESVFSLIGMGLSATQWHLEYLGKLSTCNCQDLGLLCCLWFGLLLSPETAISRHRFHHFP